MPSRQKILAMVACTTWLESETNCARVWLCSRHDAPLSFRSACRGVLNSQLCAGRRSTAWTTGLVSPFPPRRKRQCQPGCGPTRL